MKLMLHNNKDIKYESINLTETFIDKNTAIEEDKQNIIMTELENCNQLKSIAHILSICKEFRNVIYVCYLFLS